ncbi:MAG: hypothetical protein LAQ30_08495, partial [Acidobacteriia bacterium]|nr:hypothetical protein [Terriglobia bacterium]
MHLFFVALIAFSLSFSAFSQTYVVGSVIGGAIPDNIPGTAANLGSPWAIARDQAENTLVTLHHYHSVLRLNAEGVLTRVAGTGIPGYNGDSGPAESI